MRGGGRLSTWPLPVRTLDHSSIISSVFIPRLSERLMIKDVTRFTWRALLGSLGRGAYRQYSMQILTLPFLLTPWVDFHSIALPWPTMRQYLLVAEEILLKRCRRSMFSSVS